MVQPATDAHGSDVGPTAAGSSTTSARTSSSAMPGRVDDRLFEIEFLDAGVEAYCFTFG